MAQMFSMFALRTKGLIKSRLVFFLNALDNPSRSTYLVLPPDIVYLAMQTSILTMKIYITR